MLLVQTEYLSGEGFSSEAPSVFSLSCWRDLGGGDGEALAPEQREDMVLPSLKSLESNSELSCLGVRQWKKRRFRRAEAERTKAQDLGQGDPAGLSAGGVPVCLPTCICSQPKAYSLLK